MVKISLGEALDMVRKLTLSCDEKDAEIHWLKQGIRDIGQAAKVKGVELPHERPRA